MSDTASLVGGKYRLIRPLAQGGMGKIWVARHAELGTEVAVKRLAFEASDLDLGARFRREAMTLAQLKSRHIVHVYDLGQDEEGPYIVMELLAGEDLSQFIERTGPASGELAFSILEQVGKALIVAHSAGIIHRDIKPSNVFLTREAGEDQPVVKVLDFGIAKRIAFGDGNDSLTESGHIIGSPGYMSPEQIRGKTIDERSDVWGLTALYYELLTGETAFDLEHRGDALFNICQGAFIPIDERRSDLAFMAPLFRRGFAPNLEDRFQTVQALLHAARELVKHELSMSRNAGLMAGEAGAPAAHRAAGASLETKTMDVFSGETGDLDLRPKRARRVWVAAILVALGASVGIFALRGLLDEGAPAERKEADLSRDALVPQAWMAEEAGAQGGRPFASEKSSGAEETVSELAPSGVGAESGRATANAPADAQKSATAANAEASPRAPARKVTPQTKPASPAEKSEEGTSSAPAQPTPKQPRVDSFTGLPISD
jgi:hypothetical protein